MLFTRFSEFRTALPPSRRLLGLDFGQRKIGIALTDPLRAVATPHSVLERQSFAKDLAALGALIQEYAIGGIVIGLPLSLDGTETEQCLLVRQFAEKLLAKHPLPILLQDERMSTAAANRALKEDNMRRRERHQIDDKIAASLVLQTVLDGL